MWMMQGSVRWLLDSGLPRTGYEGLDAVHVDDFSRVPGPAGIREALALDRTLVTCAEEFRGPCALILEHPGIVVLELRPVDGPEIIRNLLHLEFRLSQYAGALKLTGNRFLVRLDRELLQIMPDGTEVGMEPWKAVHIQTRSVLAV
jgi:hypothetical protein